MKVKVFQVFETKEEVLIPVFDQIYFTSSVFHCCYYYFLFYFIHLFLPFIVPAGQGPPYVDGYNSSTMLVTWDPPVLQNGPDPSYQVQRVVTALSGNPPRVEKGARFTGAGYYLFSGTILPYSAYTGKWEWNLSITPFNSNGAISDYHIFLNKTTML